MVDQLTLQTIGILLTGISLTVAATYYTLTLRNTQKARQIEMLWRLYESKHNEQSIISWMTILAFTWDDFEDYMEKYGPFAGHPEAAAQVSSHISFMDGLAKIVEENVVDLDTVYNMFGDRVLITWFKLETIVKAFRVSYGTGPDYGTSFESLANKMMSIKRGKGLPLPVYYLHPTSELHQELKT